MESTRRLGEFWLRRVISARGGGRGALVPRFGEIGIVCTWSSKQTFRRRRTGDSAKETDFKAGGGRELEFPFKLPLYGGGDLYGGALMEDFKLEAYIGSGFGFGCGGACFSGDECCCGIWKATMRLFGLSSWFIRAVA